MKHYTNEHQENFDFRSWIKYLFIAFINKHPFNTKWKKEFRLYLKSYGFNFLIRSNTSDKEMLTSIIFNGNDGRKEYDLSWDGWDTLKNGGLIIDAGANIGLFSCIMAKRFPKANIISIEPDKTNFSLLLKNTSQFSNIRCLCGALWNERCKLNIKSRDTGEWGFIVTKADNGKGDIDAYCVSDLIEMYDIESIDVFKIDIEGSELELMQGDLSWIEQTKLVMIETHDRFKAGSDQAVSSVFSKKTNFKETKLHEDRIFIRT